MTRYHKLKNKVKKMEGLGQPKPNSSLIAKNTAILYIRMIVVMLVGLFTSRIMLQALGVKDFGLQNLAGGVIGMVTFFNASLSSASSRFLTVAIGEGHIGRVKRAFSTILIVQIILAVLFTILLETIGVYFLEAKLNIDPARIRAVKWMYHCAVVSTFLSITQIPYSAILIARERLNAFAWMTIYDVFFKLLIAFLIASYTGDKLILLAFLLLTNSAISILIYRLYCIYHFREARFKLFFDFKLFRQIFSFAGWHIATQLVVMLLTQGVMMLNQRYFGPILISAISIGQALNTQIQGFINNFKLAANPQIIKLYAAQKYEEAKALLIETVHFSIYLLLLLGVPAFLYSEEILRLWLGEGVPTYSSIIAKITLIGAFFSIFDVSLYVILYATGRIAGNMYLNVITGGVAWCLIFCQVYFFRNPLASVITLAGFQFVLGVINKPILLCLIAKYTWSDLMRIFVPSFKALLSCSIIGWACVVVLPKGVWWTIISCVIIMLLNALILFVFFMSLQMKLQVLAFVQKVPVVGIQVCKIVKRLARL